MGIVAVHVRLVLAGPSSNVRYGVAGVRGREGGSMSNHVFFSFQYQILLLRIHRCSFSSGTFHFHLFSQNSPSSLPPKEKLSKADFPLRSLLGCHLSSSARQYRFPKAPQWRKNDKYSRKLQRGSGHQHPHEVKVPKLILSLLYYTF